MAPRRRFIVQENFSGGAFAVTAGYLVPEEGSLKVENGLLDDHGLVYRRGGARYLSKSGLGSPLTYLWEGEMEVGRRKLLASADAFGALDFSDSAVTLGGDGLRAPVQSAYVGGLLFIGGGWIYGGSLRDSAEELTVGVTADSTTVTGSNLNEFVDPGSLMQIGDDRVYLVKSVSASSLELAEPYQGSTDNSATATFHSIYKIREADPYPISDGYASVVGRLLAWNRSILRFSAVNNPHEWGVNDYHEVPGEEILGVGVIQQDVLIFTDQGAWTLSGLALNIVDATGNPQHRLALLSRDLILWHGAGIASWDQALVVPCIDAIWVIDGVSTPFPLTRSIEQRYRRYVKLGYRPGKPAVYQGHLLFPVLTTDAAPRDLMVCRIDAPYGDEGQFYPWSWFTGNAGEVAALALEVGEEDAPRLLAAETRDSARVLDMTSCFSPGPAVERDPDESVPKFVLETRVYPTGDGTKNQVRSVRTRYTMRSAAGGAKLELGFAEDVVRSSGPKWGQVKWGHFKWGAPVLAFTNTDCPMTEGPSEVHRCRINKFMRFIRLRYVCNDPTSTLVISGIEIAVRPSGAIRR